MVYIKRAITSVIKKRLQTSKCLPLTGARQVGKSTLIKHTFPNFNKANFDDNLTRLQAKEEPKLFFLNNPCPFFIYEVQKEKNSFDEIKLRVDNSEERGNFILSGSQKLELMSDISESLAGRVSILELLGLSLREIFDVDFNNYFIPTNSYLKNRETCLTKYTETDI